MVIGLKIWRVQRSTKAMLLALCCLLMPQVSNAQDNTSITLSQRIETTERIRTIVLGIVNDELRSHFSDQVLTPRVQVQLSFDEQRLRRDAEEHRATRAQAIQMSQNAVGDNAKSLIRELTQTENIQRPQIRERSQGVRFGRLNIDIDREAIDHITSAPPPSQIVPQISLQLSNPTPDLTPFTFNPMDYIQRITIEISLPMAAPTSAEQRITDLIYHALYLSAFGEQARDWVTISRLEPPHTPGVSEWTTSLWSAENQTLGLIAAGISLGLFAVLAAMLLAKMLSKIAHTLGELRPKEEAAFDAGASSADNEAAPAAVVIDAEPTEVHHSERRKHDQTAATTALTAEMKNIRQQLEDIISENEQLIAELIIDMFYDKHGLEDFRDLLSFAGYKTLKPAMERLPRKAIIEIQTYIEDYRDDDVNLLNGCEVAQRLYRDCVSKITASGEETSAELTNQLKTTLVGTDDAIIKNLSSDLDASRLSIILRNLSSERGNMLMRHIEAQKLKEACALLDQKLDNEEDQIKSIISSLQQAQSQVKEVFHLQRRFILRLAKSSTIAEEDSILNLVPKQDIDLRKALMQVRFFVCDLPHVPKEHLKKVFDTIDIPTRAEILVVSPNELQEKLKELYPESSKVKEMLLYEVESLRADQSRIESIERKSEQLLGMFTAKVKEAVTKNESLMTAVLSNIQGTQRDSTASASNENAAA